MRAFCGWACVALLVAACGGAGTGADAPDVAGAFWAAVKDGDLERARAQASRISAPRVDEWAEGYAIETVALGQTLRNESAAAVETTLTTGSGEFELHPSFQTYLVREDGAWRVDVARTQRDLERAILAAAASRVRSALAEGVHEMGEALEHGMDQLEEALRGTMPPE